MDIHTWQFYEVPIPGQESRNTDMIIEYDAGWKAITIINLYL